MAKRKSPRMFSREERAAHTAAVRAAESALTQEMRDRRAMSAAGIPWQVQATPSTIADDWLALRSLAQDRTPEETEAMRAIERAFLRLTGDTLTEDTAYAYIDTREER